MAELKIEKKLSVSELLEFDRKLAQCKQDFENLKFALAGGGYVNNTVAVELMADLNAHCKFYMGQPYFSFIRLKLQLMDLMNKY